MADSYYVIIRGAMGIGKITVAEILADVLKAKHYEMDRILHKENIEEWEDGYISIRSFIKLNEILSGEAEDNLKSGTPVIFDANFYFKEQIEDLIKRLNYPYYVFTLKASLFVCINRDASREKSYGRDAAEAVYKKSSEFDYGEIINSENKSVREVVDEIYGRLK